MTPEIRRKLENNTTPFGLMEPELQEALREAINAGARLRRYDGNIWNYSATPPFAIATYRLAPASLIIPDALWELLDKEWAWIAKDKNGEISPYATRPIIGNCAWLDAPFGSRLDTLFPNLDPYNCDWRNSLVMRPGYEGCE